MLLDLFTSPLSVNDYVRALWPGKEAGSARVVSVIPVSDHAVAVTIRPGFGWSGHRAGQFVTIGLDVDGVRYFRCYSLTSPPDRSDGCIEIAVAAVDGGVVSNAIRSVRPGTVVSLSPADGEFTLPSPQPQSLLFLTGGSGITPVLGILRSLRSTRVRSDTVIVHHAPDAGRVMFADELTSLAQQLGARLTVVHTRDTNSAQYGPRLDRDRLAELCPDWTTRTAFVCGPESLLDGARRWFADAGVVQRLHTESFVLPTLPARPASSDAPSSVQFTRSDVDALTDGSTSLLEVAESAGLVPLYGCRSGVCHTCSTPLLEGRVHDARKGVDIVGAPGVNVQLCVCTAVSDVLIDL